MSELILAIMLWMGLISAPNQYVQTQLDLIQLQNQNPINMTLTNQPLCTQIWNQYGQMTTLVRVTDETDD